MENSGFDGDRPIRSGEEDRLGFIAPATHVAAAISNFASAEGFVFGLEGSWGSGKTSLLNLISDALRAQPTPPEIVKFSPWLISSRNALLGELFTEIAQAAERIDILPEADDPTDHASLIKHPIRSFRAWYAKRSNRRRKLRDHIARFAVHLSRASKLSDLASLITPYGLAVSSVVKATEKAVDVIAKQPSLDKEKELLKSELRHLTRRIIIFVDDLDRLEPFETCEIVRLVRAVADFPNIIYVLCYSRPVLAKGLSEGLKITDGEKYIEKIVQASFVIPRPEDFDLRRIFREDLERAFPSILGNLEERDYTQQRISLVIDIEGARTLKTPRDVIRTINALRLYAGPVIDSIDIADMIWLQMIRIRNVRLYDWIESYVNNFSAVSSGASVSDNDVKAELKELRALLEEDHASNIDSRISEISKILSGIEQTFLNRDNPDSEPWKLFSTVPPESLSDLIANRRLGSPQHFRWYFALSRPSGAMDDSEFDRFLRNASSDVNEAVKNFKELAIRRRPQGGIVADAILDRLQGDFIQRVQESALEGIIISLAHGMDDAARAVGLGEWGRYWIWDTADRVFAAALARLTPDRRKAVLERAFGSGVALGWLTQLYRREFFAHGRRGDHERPEDERYVSAEELDLIKNLLCERFQTLDPATLVSTPQLLTLLFAWVQSGPVEAEQVKAWIGKQTQSDLGFVTLLNNMRSWTAVNDAVYYPIRKHNISNFMDYDEVRARVERLLGSDDAALRGKAKELLAALKQGERD